MTGVLAPVSTVPEAMEVGEDSDHDPSTWWMRGQTTRSWPSS